jgi:hypothetical protein
MVHAQYDDRDKEATASLEVGGDGEGIDYEEERRKRELGRQARVTMRNGRMSRFVTLSVPQEQTDSISLALVDMMKAIVEEEGAHERMYGSAEAPAPVAPRRTSKNNVWEHGGVETRKTLILV